MNSLLQRPQAQLTIGYSPGCKWHSCTFERALTFLSLWWLIHIWLGGIIGWFCPSAACAAPSRGVQVLREVFQPMLSSALSEMREALISGSQPKGLKVAYIVLQVSWALLTGDYFVELIPERIVKFK